MTTSTSVNLRDHPKSVVFTERFPIITATLSGCESMNSALLDAIERVGHRDISRSNLRAHRTDWHMYEEGQAGAPAFQQICEVACQFARDNSPRSDWEPMVTSCWGAIYEQGDIARAHDHWPSIWSFVYFVKVGDQPSPLVFTNAQRAITPRAGMLCLFPGWVVHEVPAQQSASRRVMVAGNISPKTS